MIQIAIVVVNYGTSDLIAHNLTQLPSTTPASQIDVVIVDNYSSGDERSRTAELCRERGWEFVGPETNLGFGAGANAGVDRALALGAEVVCLLNPDAEIALSALETIADRALADPTSLRAPLVTTDDGTPWFRGASVERTAGWTVNGWAGGAAQRPDEDPNAWLSGACLVFHRQAWALTEGFNSAYFLYWEDVDLSWRHRAAGGSLSFDDDVVVRHSVGGSQRTEAHAPRGKSTLYLYYNCRNRLFFAADHLTPAEQKIWVRRTPAYAKRVLLRGGRRPLLKPWGPVTAVLRGSWDGVRQIRTQKQGNQN